MKYNQQNRKSYLENQLKDIFIILNIPEEQIEEVTFKDIRLKLNEIYPPITAPKDLLDYPANDALYRDRKRILNSSRYILYELNTIRNREKNAN